MFDIKNNLKLILNIDTIILGKNQIKWFWLYLTKQFGLVRHPSILSSYYLGTALGTTCTDIQIKLNNTYVNKIKDREVKFTFSLYNFIIIMFEFRKNILCAKFFNFSIQSNKPQATINTKFNNSTKEKPINKIKLIKSFKPIYTKNWWWAKDDDKIIPMITYWILECCIK